jgi:hypothetical protein
MATTKRDKIVKTATLLKRNPYNNFWSSTILHGRIRGVHD